MLDVNTGFTMLITPECPKSQWPWGFKGHPFWVHVKANPLQRRRKQTNATGSLRLPAPPPLARRVVHHLAAATLGHDGGPWHPCDRRAHRLTNRFRWLGPVEPTRAMDVLEGIHVQGLREIRESTHFFGCPSFDTYAIAWQYKTRSIGNTNAILMQYLGHPSSLPDLSTGRRALL